MGGLIKTVIRHKFVQNIPDIWPIPQLFLPLQRQNSKNRSRTMNIRLEQPKDYCEVK